MAIRLGYIDGLADSLSRRERLERTARIVSGGTCPHALILHPLTATSAAMVKVAYCEKPVNPLTGEHVGGSAFYHRAGTTVWNENTPDAFIE